MWSNLKIKNCKGPHADCEDQSFSTLVIYRYFEDDDEVNADDLEYQPAPGSPTLDQQKQNDDSSDSEDDPLDAFMAGIEVNPSI